MNIMKLILILFLLGSTHWATAQKPGAIEAYNAGLEYYKLGNYKDAIPFFEAAVKKDPNFIPAFRVLITCREQEGQHDLAANLYEKVIEMDPSNKTLCYNLALTYLDLKKYNKSILYLKKALDIDPTYGKAATQLKEIETYLTNQKQNAEARGNEKKNVEGNARELENKVYKLALKNYQAKAYEDCLSQLKGYAGEITNPDFYYLRAITLQNLGDRAAGILDYERVLELDDLHFNTNLNLGRIHYNDKDYKAATELLETAYSRRENDLGLLYDLAKAHYYNKNYLTAISYLEAYLKQNSDGGEAWRILGDSYSKTGKSRSASKAFEKADRYSTANDELYKHLEGSIAKYGREASGYSKEGNYKEAITVLEKGIMEHSKAASLHFNLGLNYIEVGNVKKASEEFRKTIDLEPAHAKAYQGLGLIHYEREEYRDAGAYYLATIEAGKQDEFVYYKLGSCYFKLKKFSKAVEAYQQSIQLNSKEKRYYFGLGASHIALNEHYDAIAAMQIALELDPMYLAAQYNIAVAYLRMSQYEKSITEAEKILAKNSEYAKAYLVIGNAHKRMGNYILADNFQKKAERMDPSLKQ
jgi:tetratricopeptide (TPR) repeat protein